MMYINGDTLRRMFERAANHIDINDEISISDLLDILMESAQETLGKTPGYLDAAKPYRSSSISHDGQTVSDVRYTYCAEFVLNPRGDKSADIEKAREAISGMGDSMFFVNYDETIKIRAYTDRPGRVLDAALSVGELTHITIDNMRDGYEKSRLISPYEGSSEDIVPAVDRSEDGFPKYSIVAVSMGAGFEGIFRNLGVDCVIEGGQMMNPDTEDILGAIEGLSAENIIVLPNNTDIIPAVNRAKEISRKNVYIVHTASIPEGIAAMLQFDQDDEPKSNTEEMSYAAKAIRTVQITSSVENRVTDGISIKRNDIIGMAEGHVSSVGSNIDDVLVDTLKKSTDDSSELITVYSGTDIQDSDIESLRRRLEDEFEDFEIEIYFGGQPVYYYICSIE